MAISYVGVSTAWSSSAASTSYTLNLPGGTLQSGDLMVAFLVWTTGGSSGPILSVATNPSGWTRQDVMTDVGDSWPTQIAIFTKAYASGDPSTWTGTLSTNQAKVKVSGTVAYRGVQGILSKGTAEAVSGSTSYSVPASPLNATMAGCWRVAGAGVEWTDFASSLTINDTSRLLGQASAGTDFIQLRIADSNADIATGTSGGSRTVSKSGSWDSSAAWLALLQPSSATPSTGDLNATVELPTMSATAELTASGTLAASVDVPTFAAIGAGQPQPADGVLTASVELPTATLQGGTPPTGTLAGVVEVQLRFFGETRQFGVRVIAVEREPRLVVVPSRGVDD